MASGTKQDLLLLLWLLLLHIDLLWSLVLINHLRLLPLLLIDDSLLWLQDDLLLRLLLLLNDDLLLLLWRHLLHYGC